MAVASAAVSQTICSQVFLSELDPRVIYDAELRPVKGMGFIGRLLSYHVDRVNRSVTTSILGGFKSTSVFYEGFGARLVRAGDVPLGTMANGDRHLPAALPDITGPEPVKTTDGLLTDALDAAFQGRDGARPSHTRAVVVVYRGRVIAERYAPGIGLATPLPSHSVAKSVINALVGVLVREGALSVEQRIESPAWNAACTVDQLLRMNAGLPLDEGGKDGEIGQRMFFLEPDTAAFAERVPLVAPPGSQWRYSSLSYAILSRLIRDAVGGTPAKVVEFANRELFAPLGMRNATVEFDGAGSAMGANAVYASARDWARFGLLYLNDGRAGSQRILPEGWVSYSTRRTLDSGYGAGFWLNPATTTTTEWGLPGAPEDSYMARGYLGQYIVVVPPEELVVVRFGVSHGPNDCIEAVGQLVADVIRALHR